MWFIKLVGRIDLSSVFYCLLFVCLFFKLKCVACDLDWYFFWISFWMIWIGFIFGVDTRRMHWNELSGSDWLINIVNQSRIIHMYLCAVQKSIDNKSSSQNQYQFIYFRCFFSIILNKLDFDPKYFWAWTDFQSYLDFMLAIWFVGAVITFFMLPFTFFMESVGFMAVFIEAMLGKRFWFIANGNHFLHRTKMTMFFFYSI